ncbi:hypothetical protein PM082_006961 [Marasmius tenuissimus]|nr:hypothetical protein PM082_006961 [Marasmius tenuissimus]
MKNLAACILLIALSFFVIIRRKRRKLPLPPGPRPLPLLGNFFDIPVRHEWEEYVKWGRKYNSDILYHEFYLLKQVTENDHDERIDRVGFLLLLCAILVFIIALRWDWSFTLMPYGKRWKDLRKPVAQEFNLKQSDKYEPQHAVSLLFFLKSLLNDPDDFYHLLRHMASSSIQAITYGITPRPASASINPVVAKAEKAVLSFALSTIPGSFWVDYMPLLKHIPPWVPGAGFQRKAQEWRKDVMNMLNERYDLLKTRMADGDYAPACFVTHCLNSDSGSGCDEQLIREAAGAVYAAGTDTTLCAWETFFLCSNVVQPGYSELPEFEDGDHLPYIMAVVYELLRWQPVNPLCLAHLVTVDDEYNGYSIPKKSVVFGNACTLLHDESTYGPDTYEFIPERFLTEEGLINPRVPEPLAGFGFGRRICPGRHFAISSTFVVIASVLQSFRISKALDEDGREIEPTGEFLSTLQNRPAPYSCKIQVRTVAHKVLIESSVAGLNDELGLGQGRF